MVVICLDRSPHVPPPITNEPLGALPPRSDHSAHGPLAMPMRMAATEIPVVQILASILLLAFGVAVLAWLAGKIYRVGILSTGKKATLRELVQWLQAS